MNKYIPLFIFMLLSKVVCSQSTLLHEDFTNCISSLPISWQKYSVVGSDIWECTTSGQSGNAIQMNGYSSSTSNDNEDWLISPLLNLNGYSNPMLSFGSRTKYNGDSIKVFVSNNYLGIGNPTMAIWNSLPTILPSANSDIWLSSEGISLLSFKNQPLHIAFKYISNISAAALWKIDDIHISDGTLTVSKKFINVGQTITTIPATPLTFNFAMSNVATSFDVNVPVPFELSKDGSNYDSQLNYTSAISGVAQTVYVRINPSISDKVFRNEISFILNGNILPEKIMLLGTSLPNNKTLRVYSWNMKWFGDPSLCNCDTNLATINATQIMKDINADIYCLQEVVDNNKIAIIASQLGNNYHYVVSTYCSFATNTADPSYSSGQKLAYIYNTDKIENLGTFGLLASTYPADASSSSAYYCFASGRFPFVMKAKIKLDNGLSDTIIFSNIHAKAISDVASYNRRKGGAIKMTDSLQALFPNKKIIVIGDYNDYLEGSSVTSISVTPYKYMLDNSFMGITLPSKYPNQTTFVGSTNHILDNIACTPNLMSLYPDSSCFIFNEVEKYITDYGNSTSDHLPVMSYFKFNFPQTVNVHEIATKKLFYNIVNPSSNILTLILNSPSNDKLFVSVFDIAGKLVYHKSLHTAVSQQQFDLSFLQQGIYFVAINNSQQYEVKKWMNNK